MGRVRPYVVRALVARLQSNGPVEGVAARTTLHSRRTMNVGEVVAALAAEVAGVRVGRRQAPIFSSLTQGRPYYVGI